MAELWTRPKVSHRLFRACQCWMENTVSDPLFGTTLYDGCNLLVKVYGLAGTVHSVRGHFETCFQV